MGLILSEAFQHCSAKVPMPVMARLVMERALPPEKIDGWFEANRERQYTRDLLFSSVFEVMSLVAVKVFTSTHAAYQANKDAIGVSVTSLYNKINSVDGKTSRALVRESAVELGKTVRALKGQRPDLLPGYRVKLLPGGPGRLPARGSHRSGRARLAHPAPRVTVLLGDGRSSGPPWPSARDTSPTTARSGATGSKPRATGGKATDAKLCGPRDGSDRGPGSSP